MRFTLVVLFTLLAAPLATAEPVAISGGVFQMGCSKSDDLCEEDEGRRDGVEVFVPLFMLDSHEVTVREYTECVTQNMCSTPKDFQLNKYCNYGAEGREEHPVNCVDWQQAVDYCTWKEGRLPYEAEWEKAARGGTILRYPWGEDISCKQAVLDEISPATSLIEPDGCYLDTTSPVGSRDPNAYGLYDMHGNVAEWTANWYSKDAVTTLYPKGDLAVPGSGDQRVIRGGSWDENKPNLRSSFRNAKLPVSGDSVYGSIGFRCAYDIQ